MSIDKAKEILAARTTFQPTPDMYRQIPNFGHWKYEAERYSAKDVIGIHGDDRWIATCQPEFNGTANARSIVLLNNIADELFAVHEAAKNITHELDDYFSTTGDLKEAIKALEAKLAKELP